MNCPACNAPLVVVERNSIELDWCVECQGVWLDDGELELLVGARGGRFDPNAVVEDEAAGRGEASRRCPRCRRTMAKATVGRAEPVLADRCRGHGLWLDEGELDRIVGQAGAAEAAADEPLQFVGETFRRKRPEK